MANISTKPSNETNFCTGALVGPPWSKRENGFIFTEKQDDGISLYYEPHCQAKENSFEVDSVDAVITPICDQIIGGVYPLVRSFPHTIYFCDLPE